MTKKDIVEQISRQTNIPQIRIKEIVRSTFDCVIDTLVREGRIELRNFGVFEVRARKARKARNPKTNEEVAVPAKNVVTFQPGKKMEERVRKEARVYLPKPRKTKSAKTKKPGKKSRPARPVHPTPPPPNSESGSAGPK